MKRTIKQIITLCLISGLVNQAMLFGKTHLSPCGVVECSVDTETTVQNYTLLGRLKNHLMQPVFLPDELEQLRQEALSEPRGIRYLIRKYRSMFGIDFSKKLVRYSLITGFVTAFIDQVTKLTIVYTCPEITNEKEFYAYVTSLLPLKYDIHWEDSYEQMVDVVMGLFFVGIVLNIISKIKRIHARNIVTAIFGGLYIGGGLSNLPEGLLRGGVVDWIPGCLYKIPNIADFAAITGMYGLIRYNIDIIVRSMQRYEIKKTISQHKKFSIFMNTKLDEYVQNVLMWICLVGSYIITKEFIILLVVLVYETINTCIFCIQKIRAYKKMSLIPVIDVDAVKPLDLPDLAGVSSLTTSK